MKKFISAIVCVGLLLGMTGCDFSDNAIKDPDSSGIEDEGIMIGDGEAMVFVRDAYVVSAKAEYDPSTTVCCHIPTVDIPLVNTIEIDSEIYNTFYPMTPTLGETWNEKDIDGIHYICGRKEDVLSILVEIDLLSDDASEFFVYNISIKSGEKVDDDAVLGIYGLSRKDFEQKVADTYEHEINTQEWIKDYAEEAGQGATEALIRDSLSSENLSLATPFINDKGELCFEGGYYVPAASGYTRVIYNLDSGEQLPRLTCAEHSGQ